MTSRGIVAATGILLLAFLMAAGCAEQPQAGIPSQEHSTGTITVFAAASLTESFTDLGKAYEAARPGVKVIYNFDGSNALRTQIGQGADPDVFVSADMKNMKPLQAEGYVDNETVVVFARNTLVVIIPEENPGTVLTLSDLARPGLRIVTGTPEVPVGNYTLRILDRIAANGSYGSTYRENVLANVASQETTVKNVVAKIVLGEADAGFVYRTDAMAQKGLRTIGIPDSFNVAAEYPIGAVSRGKNPGLARDFIAFVTSEEGSAILSKHGFIPVHPAG